MENKSSQTSNVRHGLKKIPPYWYPYTTMTKMRWIGRELLEVVSTEFRDRSMEYYVRCKRYESVLVIDENLIEICPRIWSHNSQWQNSETRYDFTRRRSP